MASPKIKTKRPNTGGKSRALLVLFALIVLIAGIGLALWSLKQGHFEAPTGGSRLQKLPPAIESVPGVETSSEEYAKLQRAENLQRVEEAEKKQTAAVPTVSRTGYVASVEPTEPEKPVVNHAGCSKEDLERARQAGVKAEELRCKGCSAKELCVAGYSAAELKSAGFLAGDLKGTCFSIEELKAAGFSAKELKDAGFSAAELKAAGFSAAELKDAGYSAKELMDAGYSAKELKDAGFSAAELKAAGFSAKDLKDAGYSAAELKDAGFSASELNAAGFSPAELLAAGYSKADLEKVGIRTEQINAAAAKVGAINMPKDCSVAELTKAKKQNISAAELKKRLSCPVAALKAAGYSASELKAAGYSAGELKAGGFNAKELKAAGFSAKELKAAGFTAKQLREAGFSAAELREAGYSANELCEAGFTATELLGVGFTPAELRGAACIGLEGLKEAGVDAAALKKLGLTDGELTRAGFAPEQVAPPPPVEAPAPAAPAAAPATLLLPEVSRPENEAEDIINRMQKQQAARLSEQQKQELLQQIQVSMASQANDLFSSWNAPPAQQRVVGDESKADGAAGAAGAAAGTAAGGKAGQSPVNGQTIKAGTIMFATLDTGVNSDEESPILATIVQGKLKGTKLLGQFKRVEKKVVLSFSVMSVPNLSNSLTVNAVAIDPDTARTAVASDVDSHYLLRYGTLFASSFMSGFGQAVSESGATVVDKSSGDTLITNPATSTQEKGLVALGEVGKQFGKQFGSLAHTPPTVKVDAGAGLGILFMADTVVPEGN